MWPFSHPCNHDWETKEKIVTESALEVLHRSGYKSIPEINMGMMERKYICIMVCKKCGEMDKTIEVLR